MVTKKKLWQDLPLPQVEASDPTFFISLSVEGKEGKERRMWFQTSPSPTAAYLMARYIQKIHVTLDHTLSPTFYW